MKITAAVARQAYKPFNLEKIDLSEPQDDEVLVKMVAVGLCQTDISAKDQALPISLPAVLGHEGAGIVASIGKNVTKLKVGDKVVLTISFCGTCTNCKRGDVSYCENGMSENYGGVRPDGSSTHSEFGNHISGHFFGQSSFGTYALAHQRNAVKVPDDTPLHLAAPFGCGFQTGAGTVLRSINAIAGRTVAIAGGGAVGLSAVMAAAYRKCSAIILIEPRQLRRELALELGATHVFDPNDGDIAEFIRTETGRGVDYFIDTTGVPAVIEAGLSSAASHATLVTLGVPKNQKDTISLSLLGFLASGCTLKAVIEGDTYPDEFIVELLEMHKNGHFPVEKLISRYSFEDINQAVDDQMSGRIVKAVMDFL